jgi:hypothetical protein
MVRTCTPGVTGTVTTSCLSGSTASVENTPPRRPVASSDSPSRSSRNVAADDPPSPTSTMRTVSPVTRASSAGAATRTRAGTCADAGVAKASTATAASSAGVRLTLRSWHAYGMMIAMRPTAPLLGLLAALALTACGSNGGDGSTVESPTPDVTSAGVTPPTSATPSSTCPATTPLPAGATLVTATVTGKVTTAHAQWSVKLGSKVRIAVTTNAADEVHVHGYDKKQDTVPGCPTSIDLTASIPGSVEVELEGSGLRLFDLKAS